MATNFNKPQNRNFGSNKSYKTPKNSNWLAILSVIVLIPLFIWLIIGDKKEILSIGIIVVLLASFLTVIIMMSMNKVFLFTNKADKALIVISAICFTIGVFIKDFSDSMTTGSIIFFIIAGICFIFSAFNSIQLNSDFLFGIIITVLAKAAIIYLIALSIVFWIVLIVLMIIFRRDRYYYY